jgi:hypothetical protein
MVRSTDGRYVRAWDGGRDTLGWGLWADGAGYQIRPYATVRIEAVQTLITPHIPFSPPEAASEAWLCNVNAVSALGASFSGSHPDSLDIASEGEAQGVAGWLGRFIRERIDPWWRQTRTPQALWTMDSSWRRFWGYTPHPEMIECALAFLCAPADEQVRIEERHLASAEGWPAMYRQWLTSLVRALREQRAAST